MTRNTRARSPMVRFQSRTAVAQALQSQPVGLGRETNSARITYTLNNSNRVEQNQRLSALSRSKESRTDSYIESNHILLWSPTNPSSLQAHQMLRVLH